MLIDSNIIIYASKPEHTKLRSFIAAVTPVVSAISYVEVLGYHKLTPEERQDLESFFAATQLLPLSDAVLAQAVHLRQQRKMTPGDSLAGASAIVFQHTLVTRNTSDFSWIDGLSLLDPFEISA